MEYNFHHALEDYNKRIKSRDQDVVANAQLATGRHIIRVKYTPNSGVDVSTINDGMRLQGNMHKWMKK